MYLLPTPHIICAFLFSNTYGYCVHWFPIQNTHHRRGYKFSRSAYMIVIYFHCIGAYYRPSIFCAVELWKFSLRLLHRLLPICRFYPVVDSPSLSSVFHYDSLTVALIFLWWTLLPTSGGSSIELSHRWPPQSLLVSMFHFLHLHSPPTLLPNSNDYYVQRNSCWSITLPFTTF